MDESVMDFINDLIQVQQKHGMYLTATPDIQFDCLPAIENLKLGHNIEATYIPDDKIHFKPVKI